MTRPATAADIVDVMYEQVDALRRKIGVAPIRLARSSDGRALCVSVQRGMQAKVPASITMRVRGEDVVIPLQAAEDYERASTG